MDILSRRQILEAGLQDWRKLGQALHASFRLPDLTRAAGFVAAVTATTGADGHLQHLNLTSGMVDLSVGTREAGLWVTAADVELARRISGIAREQGLIPDPTGVSQLEIALDTADQDRVGPFWSVLLTGSPANTVLDSIFDPTGRVPSLWFQRTDEHATPRQRWHFDLWLAPEVAEERIVAAVAAGGSVVYDAEAPAFTVLADPDGNRACVCTSLGRD